MKTIARSIQVTAPLDLVFDFLVDPHNLSKIWPSIVEVKSVKKSKHNDGFNFNWDYKMADMHFEGKCETIEYVPNESIAIKSTKGLDSTITWRLNPVGQGTHVALQFEYQIPSSLLKQTDEEIVTKELEHEINTVLQNLKNQLELQPAHA